MDVAPLGDPGSPGQAKGQGPDVGHPERLTLQSAKEPALGVDAQGSRLSDPCGMTAITIASRHLT